MKFKISFIGTIIFLVIIGMLLFKSYVDQKEIIKMHEDALDEIAVDTISRRFKVSYEILEMGLTQVIANPSISKAFAERDRNALAELVLEPFEKMKEAGISQFHFHLPDNTSFFRVHAPNKFGDDLTELRNMVRTINEDKDHNSIVGLEEGVHDVALRYIAPVYYEGTYVGSVELGFELGQRILNIFRNANGGEWYLYSIYDDRQKLIHSTHVQDLYPMEFTEEIIQKLKNGEIIEEYEEPYLMQMIPVDDYSGKYDFYLKRVFDNSGLIGIQKDHTRNNLIFALLVAMIGSFVLWIATKYLLGPLYELEKKIRKFEAGKLNETIDMDCDSEIGYLAYTMENMRKSIIQREEKLKELSFHDPLTGAHNRHYMKHLFKVFDLDNSHPISVIIADLDNLKKINDIRGHAAGDEYLISSTKIMKSVLRQTDNLCRVGGDEFAIILPKTDEKNAREILHRINEKVKVHNRDKSGLEPSISISLGLATCTSHCDSLENVFDLADKRMYADKNKRKGKSASGEGVLAWEF
ncbi:sensor domain-containing diguanylate cyclase [Alkalibacter mobilis]|uniref:sensor domain-containing diguanylate cyclase n=1 Tax=Alkalibacter mobilis TaxID=2787712 RepID=UPI00189FB24A|nr:diguanylate cyclase [Alkalibacter mobilis]